MRSTLTLAVAGRGAAGQGSLGMALVGYARVSTEDQATRRQLDELRAAGCRDVAEEHASGGDRDRPVLARTLARLR
ncbi:recombinase family protein, partial [Paracraurococcus lichenis]